MTSVSSAPAGWYKNPEDESQLRWWDGLVWADSTRPIQQAGSIHEGAYGGSAGQGGLAPSTGPGPLGGPGQTSGWGPSDNLSGGATPGIGGPVPMTYRLRSGGIPAMIFGVFMGLLFVAAGLFFGYESNTPANETASTTANIISLNFGSHGGVCAPIASFMVGGVQHTATSTVDSDCRYFVGEVVTVRYDPSDPSLASLPASASTKLFSWLFVVVGSLFVVLWVVGTLRTRSRIAAGTYVPRSRHSGFIRIGGPRHF